MWQFLYFSCNFSVFVELYKNKIYEKVNCTHETKLGQQHRKPFGSTYQS